MIRRKLTDKNNGIDDKNNNRQFNMEQGKRKTEDVKTLLNEEEGHEGLAKELLKLTSSLKNNFSTAGSVLKDDNAALDVMQRVASTNKENLIRESERLRHHAYESCFNCMMIMTVIFVIWSFIAMIVIMRIFHKT